RRTSMCNEGKKSVNTDQLESLKAVYKLCIETRNFEIGQLIQRNNFFMLFQGVLLASTLQLDTGKPWVEVIICTAGVLVSAYQLQMACGAKFWQEWWENRVEHYETLLRNSFGKDHLFYELFLT